MGGSSEKVGRRKYLPLFHSPHDNWRAECFAGSSSVQGPLVDAETDHCDLPAKKLLPELSVRDGENPANIEEVRGINEEGATADWSIQADRMI